MAETIKGINVVIGAETTGLSAALSDVDKKSRDIQSELKQVEKLLKLDPTNTELLAQKQQLLAQAVENTREKLNRLKSVQEQVNEQFARGEISEGQYRAFQREVAKTEQELHSFENRLKSVGPELKSIGDQAKEAADKFKSTGESIKNTGEKMSVGITAPLAGIAALATEGTEEFRKFMSRLEVNAQQAGVSLDLVNEKMRDLNAITGETDSNVEALSNILASGFKGDQFNEVVDALTGAAIKFSDTLKIEGLADGLQETLATGQAIGPFAELLDRLGVSLDDFNAGLAEAAKNGQQQQYVLDVLAKQGLAEVNAAYRKNNQAMIESANAQYDLQQAMAQLGETLLPVITAATESIADLANWFNNLDGGTQKVLLTISGIVAVIGPMLAVLGQLIATVGTITLLFGSVATAGTAAGAGMTAAGAGATAAGKGFSALLGPIGLAIAAIAALAAAAFLIVKNWEPIKEFFVGLWDTVSSATSTAWNAITFGLSAAWESIRSTTTSVFEGIATFFTDIWNGIVSFLTNTWNGITSAAQSAFTTILNVLQPILEGYKTFFSGIWEAIKNIFAGALLLIIDLVTGDFENMSKDAQAIWSNLKDAFANIWDGIKQVFLSALELIAQALGAAWDGIRSAAETAWDGIRTAISTIITATSTWIKDTWSALLDWFRELPVKLYTIGSDMFNRMKDAVTTTVTKVKDAIVTGITKAIDWLKELPSQMLQIGKDMIQGLIDGIKSMIKKVKDAVENVADSVTSGIRKTLEISSPSRVMMELGEYTGEGFALGIARMVSEVQKQAERLSAAASGVRVRPEAVSPSQELRSIFADLLEEQRAKIEMQGRLATAGGPEVHLHIGTLVADTLGLKELERTLQRYRISETQRIGG